MVVNSDGPSKARTAKRALTEERWMKADVEDKKWTSYRFKDNAGHSKDLAGDGSRDDPLTDITVDKSIDLPPPPNIEEDTVPRRVYLTRAVLSKYGSIDGCLGCAMSALGSPGGVHSDDSSQIIERGMKKDPEAALQLREVKGSETSSSGNT